MFIFQCLLSKSTHYFIGVMPLKGWALLFSIFHMESLYVTKRVVVDFSCGNTTGKDIPLHGSLFSSCPLRGT